MTDTTKLIADARAAVEALASKGMELNYVDWNYYSNALLQCVDLAESQAKRIEELEAENKAAHSDTDILLSIISEHLEVSGLRLDGGNKRLFEEIRSRSDNRIDQRAALREET